MEAPIFNPNPEEQNKLFLLEPFKEKRPSVCPNCYGNTQQMVYKHCDNLKLDLNNIDRSLYDAFLTWGPCVKCGKARYGTEITIASERKKDHRLFSSFQWEYQKRASYLLTFFDQTWELRHYSHLWGVTYFIGGSSRQKTGGLQWLDVHFLPDFAYDASKYSDPMEQGRILAQRLVPLLIAADLWNKIEE